MIVKSIVCGGIAAAALSASALAADANLANFKPASGGDGIIATEGARPWETTTPFDLKLWFDYAQRPVARPGGGAIVENRTGGWLVVDLHLIEPMTLAIAVPYTIHERGTMALKSVKGQRIIEDSGMGDIRFTPRFGILRQENAGIDLAVQASVDLPGNNNLLASWGQPSGELLLAIGRRFGNLGLLGNVFGFTAPNVVVDGQQLGAGFGARIGAEYFSGMTTGPTRLFAELEAKSMPRTSLDQGPTPAEARGGMSWCFGPGISLDLAAGGGLNDAPGSPRYRFIGGFGYGVNACTVRAEDAKKALAQKAADEKAAAEKAAADRAAAQRAAAEKAAADRAAAQKAAADKAAAEKAAAEEAARKAAEEKAAAEAAAKKDTDGDGVPDVEDNCPNEPGPAVNHGCPPAKKQLVAVTKEGIQILDKVQFAPGKAVIASASYKLLDQVASVLKAHPELTKVEVQGHTDNSGDAAKNTRLSQARADAVVKYLVKKGVEASRLVAKGYGPTVPVADNATAQGREKNRRVEFKVVPQ